jgi:two-component system NtrC family sensor kinase
LGHPFQIRKFISSFPSIQRIRSLLHRGIPKTTFGLKAKITFLILFNVVGVLLLSGYLDFHLTQKALIDLFLDRNLYIAKEIDVGIPDKKIMSNLPHIQEEMEDWLLSRPSLREINIFLFSPKGWDLIVSNSRDVHPTALALSRDQIKRLKDDKHLSSLREGEEERWLEVIVPLHSGKKVIGGIRVISSLSEAESYMNKKREQTFILTFFSILVILIMLTLFFRKLVGNPIQKLVEAMSRAEKGNLEAEAHIQSQDELGELGRHFNRMLKTIRETHEQNVQLLEKVNQFNEELTHKIEEATSELAQRNQELKLLNEALFESQRKLNRSEKLAALGQVTATMAHQIGTPLNSISGYIQLMIQEGDFSTTDRERLNIIESQLDRLADSIKNILSFTRQPGPQLRPLDIHGVLKELIHLSEPWFLTHKVKLSSSLSTYLPFVLGDPIHLQTLFLNLISNALDSMPNGGLLTVHTQHISSPSFIEKGEEWVQISIADTGIGITEESKKRIFDPFFTTKKIGEGTGLGLTICEKIIKEHLGKLEVKSEVGKGSTFFVLLPVGKRNGIEQ